MTDSVLDRLTRAAELARAGSSTDFDLNPPADTPPPGPLTAAAVLVPLVRGDDGWRVILTKRTSALRNHPGQVAFPGGKRDLADRDLAATALREAEEEIGLPPGQVTLIGALGRHDTVTRFRVTPYLGVVADGFAPRPEAGEVARVFSVPLAVLMDRTRARIEGRRWAGKRRRYFVIPYGPFYIWGATARMIVALRTAWEQTP